MPDLFAGRACTVFFKLTGKGPIRITGVSESGSKFSEEVAVQDIDLPAVSQLWAKARIVDLEDEFRVTAHTHESIQKAIVELATTHAILCRFTAFVVVDDSEVVNKTGKSKKIVQAVEQPEGWDMFSVDALASPGSMRHQSMMSTTNLFAPQAPAASAGGFGGTMAYGSPVQPPPIAGPAPAQSGGKMPWQQQSRAGNKPSKGKSALDGIENLFCRGGSADDITGLARQDKANQHIRERITELMKLIKQSFDELKAGRIPDGKSIDKVRKELLAMLSQAEIGTRLPLLQKFLRGATVELVASTRNQGSPGAALINLWQRNIDSLAEIETETVSQLACTTVAADRFWESGV